MTQGHMISYAKQGLFAAAPNFSPWTMSWHCLLASGPSYHCVPTLDFTTLTCSQR
jgi:hypothetical protein